MHATKKFLVGLATFSTAVLLGLSEIALGAAQTSGASGAQEASVALSVHVLQGLI